MSSPHAILAFLLALTLLSQTGCCCCVVPVGPQPGPGGDAELEELFPAEPAAQESPTIEDGEPVLDEPEFDEPALEIEPAPDPESDETLPD